MSRTWRTTSLSSLASRLFSQKTRHLPLATRKNYHHDEDIFPILLPSENSKGVMKHQRCCVERHYIRCSFRLICTAIATPLWSETYCALHHRITIFFLHRIDHRVIYVSLCQCLRIEHYFYKQTMYGGSRFAASK